METELAKPPNPSPFQQDAARAKPTVPPAYVAAAIYVIGSTVLIASLPEQRGGGLVGYLVTGALVGTVFGQTTSASLWSSLGKGPHWVRAIQFVGWLLLLIAGVAILIGRSRYPNSDVVLMVACSVVLHSLFMQVPLWILRYAKGLQLEAGDEVATADGERMQFGIVHMMIFTAVIAIVLGIGQVLIRWAAVETSGAFRELPVILYLALAAVLLSLPIAAAILLARRQMIALVLATLFGVLVTATEYPLMEAFRLPQRGPDMGYVVSINVVAAMSVSVYCLGLRWFGFRLAIGKTRSTFADSHKA